ncbi:hypothetical protein CAFE_28260 [Caprobacter fermentans]|uniref:Uncharacterized protein n=1 Tax=Caproicibacter fermentans TaxID=2576756 RepID=A0A6N8I2G8_9FIRM|nr:hypothetical protein [Caproicibacter fermentans]
MSSDFQTMCSKHLLEHCLRLENWDLMMLAQEKTIPVSSVKEYCYLNLDWNCSLNSLNCTQLPKKE